MDNVKLIETCKVDKVISIMPGAVQASDPPPMPRLCLVKQIEGEGRSHSRGNYRTGIFVLALSFVGYFPVISSQDVSNAFLLLFQFNAVSYRVISTVLIDSEARPSQRARVISAWVDVAQVFFSSTNASNKCNKRTNAANKKSSNKQDKGSGD